MRWLLFALVAAALLATMLLRPERHASAGVARTALPVSATATIHTGLADQLIVLTGWLTIERSASRMDNGDLVQDLTVTDLHLQGASPLGLLVVTSQSGNGAQSSTGQLRSLPRNFGQEQFPASSFIDLHVDVAAPNTNIGLVTFRNEQALRVETAGLRGVIDAWPPLGASYHLNSGCVPLISQNPDLTLNACVSSLDMAIASALVSFAVGRGGPSHLHPADIFGLTPSAISNTSQAPFLRIPCASLGLTTDGCDDGSDGTQDAIDGLSFGHDLAAGGPGPPRVYFSVAPGAQGAPASAVHQQVECPPSDPGAAPEPESDVFTSSFDGTNGIVFDGNGPIGTCTSAFPLGLIEASSARDNLVAFVPQDTSVIDPNGNGVPERPVYFSLDAASPSLKAFGFGPADILRTVNGATPTRYASASDLGLQPGDDIDAFCLGDGGILLFSLTPGSPTLAAIGAGPSDILAPGGQLLGPGPTIVRSGASLGLAPGDAIDALACPGVGIVRNGDISCDGVTNGMDAQLVLQEAAGLLGGSPCLARADVSQDGSVDSIDALLILQFDAGLVPHLPP